MGQGTLAVVMKPILMVLLFISAGLAGCFADEEEATSDVEAIFEYNPKTDIRTGTEITFDGGASLPSDGSLTYKWDFDGDGDYDETGREVDWEWSFNIGPSPIPFSLRPPCGCLQRGSLETPLGIAEDLGCQ